MVDPINNILWFSSLLVWYKSLLTSLYTLLHGTVEFLNPIQESHDRRESSISLPFSHNKTTTKDVSMKK